MFFIRYENVGVNIRLFKCFGRMYVCMSLVCIYALIRFFWTQDVRRELIRCSVQVLQKIAPVTRAGVWRQVPGSQLHRGTDRRTSEGQ